ncbi:LuxR C-terminal-related transcriptional regulator [Plantactinospora sp. KBS50]|uniref:LuxR C-terminal-related transcriptional regulator n=1 Tax=Plantactinospora sp. KBS50 TaxID=2024580 RepID=UPI000BAB0AE9|nr:LuxR family transcriptional regulator [Plantactinospora sp. KBS50]ASW53840.1 LuxR family transcriptional regulator [Plantactinospora sp. KBS50]
MGPWSFVGRAAELNRLIVAASGGTGRGIFFSGTAGIGKSRLLREGVAALPTDKYAVWSASANIATAGLPFGGLAQVLPTDQPPGLSPAGILRWAVDALHQQAAGRPIVLAIDDAHLLDPSSAALVYLIARSDDATVLGTLRNGEQVPLPIRALWTDDLVEYAELAPFTPADTRALLSAILAGPVDDVSTDRLHRLSAGNALLLRELVIAAQAGNEMSQTYGVWRWTGRLELAPSLNDLIDARIGQLELGVQAVVEFVALGEPIGLELLNRATDPRDVELAEERALITVMQHDRRSDVRLAHPLYGEVVRQRCPVTRTRRLKAHLADLIEQAGARRRDDLLRVAVWRLDSGTAQVPSLLIAAAGQAFGQYDVPLAARLARAALSAGGGYDAAELLATILMFSDQPEQALEVLDGVAAEVTTDRRRARQLTVRAMISYWGLRDASTVERIAAAAGELSDPADRARVLAFEAIMRLHGMDFTEAVRISRAVLDRPAATVAARGLARCTIAHVQAAQGHFELSARAVAGVAADAGQWRADMPYLQLALELARGTGLVLSGDLAGIDAIAADEFADLADAGDFRLGTGYLSIVRAQAARLRGQTGDALRTSLGACAVLSNSPAYTSLAQCERAQAAALRGDVPQAVEAMAESDSAHMPDMAVLYPWREQARAAVLTAQGETEAAIGVLRALVTRLWTDGFAGHEVHALHDLVRLGAADLEVGPEDPDGPRMAVMRRLTMLTEVVDGPLPPLLARHARAAAMRSGAGLLTVADEFAAAGLHLYAAEAAATAVARLREERCSTANPANLRLGELLQRCDLVRTPALWSRQPVLTEREREIATRAADGTPSRGIAEQLYLSTRTVENHLQRVYSKLGITGRSELGAALRALPDPDGRVGRRD